MQTRRATFSSEKYKNVAFGDCVVRSGSRKGPSVSASRCMFVCVCVYGRDGLALNLKFIL